jgi:predicted CXXCH cytochrome family protein
VIGATPAFADNGPHISTSGNTTVDRCAGCHRAHTAQASYLLKTDQTLLCQTCHSGFGATTDVADGVSTGNGGGALRGGGFTFALIDTVSGINKLSIGVRGAQNTTSKHDIGIAGTAWGGGASGTGTAITLECGSCHDPHGNGNYRILRPVPTDGTALALPATVAVTSVTQTAVSGTTYTYAVITAAPNTFKATDPITFAGTSAADVLIGATVGTVSDSTHFTVSARSINFASSTGGLVGYADPLAIASATGTGTTATYKTLNVHGLTAGQAVTITGLSVAGLNITKGVIATTPTTTTFTVTNATVGTSTTGGKLSGIADAKPVAGGVGDLQRIYTTTNYWAVDDHNYTGTNLPVTTTTSASGVVTSVAIAPTAFIANISQWCSTCHTRILAGSGAWGVDSGDAMYKFKHRSQNGKEYSPNCIQCHVAHGTNANMGGVSSSVGTEITGKAGDSFLLRVDSRGTCNMCHNL